ncbi:preprotein translocase subunit YajC [Dongia mobilis]|jgi:preprotein translocase subunit YajC|uniref:preprotein translocase subunit YajC n=1 Tax=Dongia sp. TaxID=1977262 RepID=UPI0026EF1BF3
MFISEAYAQTAAAAPGATDMLTSFLPLVLIFVVFWFLMIRPQQKRMKEHKALVSAAKKGDKIVTNGGILGTITKAVDSENDVEVEIATGVKVRVLRSAIQDVLNRTMPAGKGGKVVEAKAETKNEGANDA